MADGQIGRACASAAKRMGARAHWAALALLFGLAACGGGGGDGGDTGGGGTPPAANPVDVSVSASVLAPLAVRGGLADYRMTVTNAGPGAATDLVLTTTLDGGQTLGAVACAASGGATCPATLGATMNLASLPRGGTLVFSVPATIPADSGSFGATMRASAPGDTDRANDSATARVNATAPNSVVLEGDAGDFIVGGRRLQYDQQNAVFTVMASGNRLDLGIQGDQSWRGTVTLPGTRLAVGQYGGATRFGSATEAGLDWSGEGRGCNQVSGTVTVTRADYADGLLQALDLSFEQRCEGGASALRGQVHWTRFDTTVPPGPVSPPPAGLWAPAAGATPTSGSFVHLQSAPAEYVGQGRTITFTGANAVLAPSLSGNRFTLLVTGDEQWMLAFQGMNSLADLRPGYYGQLGSHPFHNPARGGMSVTGGGRSCNRLGGWLVVDEITVSNGALQVLDLRFEQTCEGSTAGPLRGRVRWVAGDGSTPPAPVNPPPAGLWAPAAGATPASGNFLYLQSQPGDYIGAGRTHLYTLGNAELNVTASGGRLGLSVVGNERWTADFQAMNSLAELRPGYYGDLRRYPFHNPVRGGLSFSGDGRGCNTLTGWFVVDAVSYSNGVLTAVDLRFQQNCEGGSAALRGRLRWSAGDNTGSGTAPLDPPPAGLWAPAADATPASGSYLYLKSDTGDYIGGGRTHLYTQANAVLSVSLSGGRLILGVRGDEQWSADFQAMASLAELRPGYYGDLRRYPFHNPVRGGLSFSGEGRGCNTLTGWFVVDSITVNQGVLSAVELRFQQHCEGGSAALRGKLRWVANDDTAPPGPVNPPPAGLWAPAAGTTPTGTSYFYLQSDPGDWVGAGRTQVYTPGNAQIQLTLTGGLLRLRVQGNQEWTGEFQAMSALATLQPGHYGQLMRYPFHNPTRGGLSFSGEGRGCNRSTGWFVVDALSIVNGVVDSIELRFQQHCDGSAAGLRGKLRWSSQGGAGVNG